MKFPCWSDYDSVYDGVDLEIHIVDHCNLNCAGCNHFCPLAEPYYIEPDYLKSQLLLAKEKIPSIKWIMLLGGEPTIHPKLLELCKITREIFPDPNIQIEILTNGKDLTQIVDNIEEYEKSKISVTVAIYDIQYNQDHLDKICGMERGGISWGRESFSQTLVDVTGNQDMNTSFFQNCHHQLPCFTLKDFKIYECPFAAHINAFKKKFNINIPEVEGIDYLNLNTLTLDQLEEFSYTPKNICKYCKPGMGWIWHRSNRSYNEYTKTVNELFFEDYQTYEMIQNLNNPCSNKNVTSLADPNFGLSVSKKNKVRYSGKVDIIIPFYNMPSQISEQLYNTLKSQTIINDCMIYLISDNSPNEKEVFNKFSSLQDLNVLILKNETRSGPGVGRNKGIKNSFNKYKFFLDADDEFLTPIVLEDLYNQAETYNADVLMVPRQAGNRKLLMRDMFCKKEYLEKNNIEYGNFYVHEDLYFRLLVDTYGGRVIQTELDGVAYNGDFQGNISHIIPTKSKIWNKLFCTYNYIDRLNKENRLDKYIKQHFRDFTLHLDQIFEDLYEYPTEDQKEEIQSAVLFAFYITDYIYKCFPDYLEETINNYPSIWADQIKKEDYNFTKYSINSYVDLQNYIFNYLDNFEEDQQCYISFIKNYLKRKDDENEFQL